MVIEMGKLMIATESVVRELKQLEDIGTFPNVLCFGGIEIREVPDRFFEGVVDKRGKPIGGLIIDTSVFSLTTSMHLKFDFDDIGKDEEEESEEAKDEGCGES